MAGVAADVERAEGKTTWVLVVLIALIFLAVPAWVRFGGSRSESLPSTPASPAAILEAGQKISFARGDLAAGDALVCEASGMVVGGRVPKLGRTSTAHLVNADSTLTATIKIHARDDGVVIARCF